MISADPEALRKQVLNSVVDLLVLDLLKGGPLAKNEIPTKIVSSFDIVLYSRPFYSTLDYLKKERLISNSRGNILTITKKGERIRQKLLEDYLDFQKMVKTHF